MIDPSVLEDYGRWLHRVATEIGTREQHDDLVQEGRVAMWRALSSYDETLGSLPSWLTRAAEMRMKDVAWGKGQPFGHEAVRGSRQVEEGMSIDEMEEDSVEALMGHVESAYHDGEILEAIRALSPKQQEYVVLRFWGGLEPRSNLPAVRALVAQFPVLKERWHWPRARAALAESLAHRAV